MSIPAVIYTDPSEYNKNIIYSDDIGDGYKIIITHSTKPDQDKITKGYGFTDYLELRNVNNLKPLATLTMTYDLGNKIIPLMQLGLIDETFSSENLAEAIHKALAKKYPNLSQESTNFLKTKWGEREPMENIKPDLISNEINLFLSIPSEAPVIIPKKDFIEEHVKLIDILLGGSEAERAAEAEEQGKELIDLLLGL